MTVIGQRSTEATPQSLDYTEIFEDASNTVYLPSVPTVGQQFEVVGTGSPWSVTISASSQVVSLSSVGTTSISSGATGFECVSLIYAGVISSYETWIIRDVHGEVGLT